MERDILDFLTLILEYELCVDDRARGPETGPYTNTVHATQTYTNTVNATQNVSRSLSGESLEQFVLKRFCLSRVRVTAGPQASLVTTCGAQ